jgi:hypothetical protein
VRSAIYKPHPTQSCDKFSFRMQHSPDSCSGIMILYLSVLLLAVIACCLSVALLRTKRRLDAAVADIAELGRWRRLVLWSLSSRSSSNVGCHIGGADIEKFCSCARVTQASKHASTQIEHASTQARKRKHASTQVKHASTQVEHASTQVEHARIR